MKRKRSGSPLSFPASPTGSESPDELERHGVRRVVKRARLPSNGIDLTETAQADNHTFQPDPSNFDDDTIHEFFSLGKGKGKEKEKDQVSYPPARFEAEHIGPTTLTSPATAAVEECIVIMDSDEEEPQEVPYPRRRTRVASGNAAQGARLPLAPRRRPHEPRQDSNGDDLLRERRDSSELIEIGHEHPPRRRPRQGVIEVGDDEDDPQTRAELFRSRHRKAAHILGRDICIRLIRTSSHTDVFGRD